MCCITTALLLCYYSITTALLLCYYGIATALLLCYYGIATALLLCCYGSAVHLTQRLPSLFLFFKVHCLFIGFLKKKSNWNFG